MHEHIMLPIGVKHQQKKKREVSLLSRGDGDRQLLDRREEEKLPTSSESLATLSNHILQASQERCQAVGAVWLEMVG